MRGACLRRQRIPAGSQRPSGALAAFEESSAIARKLVTVDADKNVAGRVWKTEIGVMLAPDGAEVSAGPVTRHVDNAMVKAIARAFRWRDMLESGEYATIREIANAEKINESYVGRVASCG